MMEYYSRWLIDMTLEIVIIWWASSCTCVAICRFNFIMLALSLLSWNENILLFYINDFLFYLLILLLHHFFKKKGKSQRYLNVLVYTIMLFNIVKYIIVVFQWWVLFEWIFPTIVTVYNSIFFYIFMNNGTFVL